MIAIKNLEIDSDNGLQKQIQVFGIDINAKEKTITVKYDVCLISPSGKVVSILETSSYKRLDKAADKDPAGAGDIPALTQYSDLANSKLGETIKSMIEMDLTKYPEM